MRKLFFVLLSLLCHTAVGQYGGAAAAVVARTENSQVGQTPATAGAGLWINWRGAKTSTIDDLGNIIDNLTTSDVNGYVSSPESSGSQFKKPSRNREGIFFNELSCFRYGTTSTFNGLHNGTTYTAYIDFKYFSQAQATTLRKIVSTNGTSATNSAVGFQISNLNSATNQHTVRVAMTAGAGGSTGPADVTCSNNTLIDGEYNQLKIVFVAGSSLTVYVRNSANPYFTQVGQDNSVSGLSAADAAATMAIGVSGAGFTGYFKHFAVWYRALSPTEEAAVEQWLNNENGQRIPLEAVIVIITGGQSNNNPGSGTNNATMSTDFPSLAIPIPNAYNYTALTSVFSDHTNYWDQMRMAKCTSDATKHNYSLQLSYSITQLGIPVYFIQTGRGSTGLIDKTASIDWYADGGVATTGDMFPNFKTLITDGINELRHVLHKTPIFTTFVWYQGENDTSDPAAATPAYRLAQENLLKSTITYVGGIGYSTSEMDFVQVNPINSGAQAADVLGDKLYMAANFKTDWPAFPIRNLYTVDVTGLSFSANHVTNTGASQVGLLIFNYIFP